MIILGFPVSYDAYMTVLTDWCAACAQESSGWCGGCEICLMISSPLPHVNCKPGPSCVILKNITP